MARLGKREREAKRSLIKANLNAPKVRDYVQYKCPLALDNVLKTACTTSAYGANGGMGRATNKARTGAKRWSVK